ENPEQVVFTLNATHALNIAINALVKDGGHCVTSGYEHNSVMRPLTARGAKISVARSALFDAKDTLRAFDDAIRTDTCCVVCTHVSNVFGYIMPIHEIDALCAKRGVPLIIDASQSAGVLPVRMCDFASVKFICLPGHKSLYGPQGTGLLICRDGEYKTLMQGGTGSESKSMSQPEFLPDRFESGTQNVHGIAGLSAGISFVLKKRARIYMKERKLLRAARKELAAIPGITIYAGAEQTGVLSCTVIGCSSDFVAQVLGMRGISVRGGLPCSPRAHESAGTAGGTVRVSFSYFNKKSDVRRLVGALGKIINVNNA
ncbi:MAG: aminotransferase class V-fold PLP-dependent enzyme, partial [Clostridia bacterium]